MIDLDHFKLVNDSFGHPGGDTVLRRSGEAIRASCAAPTAVFRVGGEEFALILEKADRTGVTELLETRPAERSRRWESSRRWAGRLSASQSAAGVGATCTPRVRARSAGRDRVVTWGLQRPPIRC